MAVNKVILVGNVGKDPEVRYLDENTAVAKIPLATSESYKNRAGEKVEQTEWHNVVLWRGLAQVAEKYVKKGSQLYIEGRIRTRSYDDRDGNKRYVTEIVGDVMQMLGRRQDDNSGQGYGQAPAQQGTPQPAPQASPQNQSASTQNNTSQGQSQAGSSTEGQSDMGGSSEGDDLPF